MANSKITIAFFTEPINGDYINFTRETFDEEDNVPQNEVFVPVRTKNGEVTVAVTIPPNMVGMQSAENFANSFNIDYNGSGLYTVNRVGNTVTIEFTNSDWKFIDWDTNNIDISGIIENGTTSTFELVSEEIVAAVDKCNFTKLDITANEPIKSLIVNGTKSTVDSPNVFKTISFIRGVQYSVQMEDVNGVVVEVGDYYYDFLNVDKLIVSVKQSVSGATVTASITDVFNLELEYSLDGITWQASNNFTGQAIGDYTMYVRDQFLCEITKDYTVDEFGTREPYVFLSKANSINFAKQEDIDGCAVFRNSENSLAYQGLNSFNYCQDILFQKCDKVMTQFKSMYSNPSVKVRSELGVETNILLVKQSNNLSRFQRMDCLYFRYGENLTAVYFEQGNYYDEFDAVTGTYTLNGNLPEFATVGQSVNVDGLGAFNILDTFFDDEVKKFVLIIDYNTVSEITETSKIESIYDILPFEIYDFEIDWSLFDVGLYDVLITNEDSNHDTVYLLSENIDIQDEHKQCLAIEYYNNNNRDIFYTYGQKNFIRIPFFEVVAIPKDFIDINIADESSEVVKSTVNDIDQFSFQELPTEMMRKLVIALSCENVFINGLGYVKDTQVESKNTERTNLYEVTARMLRDGRNISTVDGYSEENIIFDDNFDIPPFITDGTGFIKS